MDARVMRGKFFQFHVKRGTDRLYAISGTYAITDRKVVWECTAQTEGGPNYDVSGSFDVTEGDPLSVANKGCPAEAIRGVDNM